MEDILQELAKAKRGRGEITYADPDEGKLIYFKAVKKSTTNKTTGDSIEYSEYEAHEFLDRKDDDGKEYVIDEEIYMNVPPLDSFLSCKTYEEILEALGPVETEVKNRARDDDEEPRSGRSGRFSKTEEESPSRMSKIEEDVDDENDDGDSVKEFACPHGHTLGKHFLKKSECEDCEGDVYNECRRLKKDMKKAA